MVILCPIMSFENMASAILMYAWESNVNSRASVRSICLIHFVGWQCARRIITHSPTTRDTMRQSLIGPPTKRLEIGTGNATTPAATSTRQYNRHELCNPFVHLNAMRDHGDPSTWDLCLTSMFPYMLPTDDMLSSIHKHFSSLEVERTCWVADCQKNIVIPWLTR